MSKLAVRSYILYGYKKAGIDQKERRERDRVCWCDI